MATIKGILKSALKDIGLRYVTINDGSFNGSTIEPRTLALKGGEIGPLTVTTAYQERCRKVEDEVFRLFERTIPHGEWSHTQSTSYSNRGTNYTFIVKTGKNTVRVFNFTWETHRTYGHRQGLDPSYQTFWYEMQTEDKKVSDIVMA